MKKIYLGIIIFILISSILGCSAKMLISNKNSLYITDIPIKKDNNIDKSTNQQPLFLGNISIMNETIGWILKGNKVLRTVDGGKSWDDVSPYSNPADESYVDEPHAASCFYDNNTAWISLETYAQSDNKIAVYRTMDGGKKWDKTILPVTED